MKISGTYVALAFQIAWQNLRASKMRTLIIGSIILAGTALVVVGNSVADSLEQSMAHSVIGSISGDLQIYSKDSKDALALWINFGPESDLAPIDDFASIRSHIETIDNVKSVIPMGVKKAMIGGGNIIDDTLVRLRTALQQDSSQTAHSDDVKSLEAHLQNIVQLLLDDMKQAQHLSSTDEEKAHLDALELAGSAGFWSDFDNDREAALEFLENQVAPQIGDADLLFVNYLGTDLGAFTTYFDRLEIVDGTAIPEHARGFLFSKYFYEDSCKFKIARRLDLIRDAIREHGKTLASDTELQQLVHENVTQMRDILLQLDPKRTEIVTKELQTLLGSNARELAPLLQDFLNTNDQNFFARYDFFYAVIAPHIKLYRYEVGDTITIQSQGKAGYMRAVSVQVYGTFQFKGLEKSALAGSMNLLDLATFRQLYGYMSRDTMAEIRQMKEAIQAPALGSIEAEAALFSKGAGAAENHTALSSFDEFAELELKSPPQAGSARSERVSQEEIDGGVFLNAAIILKDPSRAEETRSEIAALVDAKNLNLQVVNWQEAAGVLGKAVMLLRIILSIASFIIFLVALIVLSNATMMATLQRVREYGTLRAIGAQKSFVWLLLLGESVLLGTVFGTLGSVFGAGVVALIGKIGIPAVSEQLYFFFAGPRFYPTYHLEHLFSAFAIVLGVTTLSSLYPAYLAVKVSPRTAMEASE